MTRLPSLNAAIAMSSFVRAACLVLDSDGSNGWLGGCVPECTTLKFPLAP
jgi:hypothetical protein